MARLAGTRTGRHRRASVVTILLAAAGVALVVAGLSQIVPIFMSESGYEGLASEAVATEPAEGAVVGADQARVDWDVLRGQNGDVAAWVRVGGTPIDYPVVAPSDGSMTRYLRRDFWGSWSLAGCPFLDARSGADDEHALVYGHHLTGQEIMFSTLQPCYRQEAFDGLGEMEWSTPEGGTVTLRPICALRVRKDDMGVQTFEFEDRRDFRDWLRGLVARSGAQAEAAGDMADSSTRAVTLVTCSSVRSNQPWRTVVVFVDGVGL